MESYLRVSAEIRDQLQGVSSFCCVVPGIGLWDSGWAASVFTPELSQN